MTMNVDAFIMISSGVFGYPKDRPSGVWMESSLTCGLFCLSFSEIFQIPSLYFTPIDWMPGGAFIECINMAIGWFWEVSPSCAVTSGCFLGFMLLEPWRG